MGLASNTVFTTKNIPGGYIGQDPARDRKQAFQIARTYPLDIPSIVVKTGEKGDVFPYSTYAREDFGDKQATNKQRKLFKGK